MTFMTRFLGPAMKNRHSEGNRSAIINMTSYYSSSPAANVPLYSSSKGYVDTLSKCLWYENNSDMDILTVKNMPTKCERYPLGVDPKDTVQGVLLDLGQERISYGHYTHSLFRKWIQF